MHALLFRRKSITSQDLKTWNVLPSEEVMKRTGRALTANGIELFTARNGAEAKDIALSLIPVGSQVLTSISVTVESIGLANELNETGRYDSVHKRLAALDPRQLREKRQLGAAPDFAVGSVHAVTEAGELLITSLTGSQLPAYAEGAGTVIWIVGAQKIVRDVEEGMRRIREYLVDRETERAKNAYGLPSEFRSFPSKTLILSREIQPGRAKLILVHEVLGH